VNGSLLWSIPVSVEGTNSELLNFYTPLYIPNDIDGDDIPDLVGRKFYLFKVFKKILMKISITFKSCKEEVNWEDRMKESQQDY
jgi:hypothetical protein